MSFGQIVALSIFCGFLLDLLFADPSWIPHPVVIIGKLISGLEIFLRGRFPETPKGERTAGKIMTLLVVLITFAVTVIACYIAWGIHPAAFFALHTIWCWQAIACKGLGAEAENVRRELEAGQDEGQADCPGARSNDCPNATSGGSTLIRARRAVGRIVGRDTVELSEEGVIKAAVETVAENFSDGVAAPLFYMMIGGAPLALTYKAVNTMDSMVGYKNEKYLDFGRSAALLDDVVNYIPARIAAILWIAAAGLLYRRAGASAKIWKRDRRNHASPNSAQTEAACAGALGVQLAGPSYYFGELYEKPYIGDAERPIEAEDITRSVRMMQAASVMAVVLAVIIELIGTAIS